MGKVKILKIDARNKIKCSNCNSSVNVKELLENGEKVADIIISVCPVCGEEILIRE